MSQIWVVLVTGEYGYMWGDALPLPGDTVTIRVRQTNGTMAYVTGICSRASW